jgi:hypothetical protein
MSSYFEKLANKISPAKVFILFILIFDFLLFIFSIKGYYFSFLKPTGAIIPVLLTLIAFYVFARNLKNKAFWIVLATVLVLPTATYFTLKIK